MNNEIPKTTLYGIQGGLGKNILFSGAVSALAKKDRRKISIMCPAIWMELFKNHRAVQNVIPIPGPSQKVPSDYKDYFDNIVYTEPYLSSYWYHDVHFYESLYEQLELKLSVDPQTILNEVKTTDLNKNYVEKLKNTIKSPYIIIQLQGGSTVEGNRAVNDPRSCDNSKEIICSILEHFRNYWVIIVRTSVDFYDKEIFAYERVGQVENENILNLIETIKNAAAFVSIDSMVPHAAANFEKSINGIVLWSVTSPISLGHNNINLKSEKINSVSIDTKIIIDNLENLLKNG
jgi:ADP-heptose:LPS heptosyltransferase